MEFVVKLLIGIVLLVAGFLAVVGWQSFTRGTTIARLRAPGDADGPPARAIRCSARRSRC